MGSLFPDILLPDILGLMDIDVLLLAAMPVSRSWRAQVLGHPTYWRSIHLVDRGTAIKLFGPDPYPAPRCLESVDLLLLRLSRTYDRPINVTLSWVDPAILAVILPHMWHIRRLDICSLILRWEPTIRALSGTPAPMLESLTLSCRYLHDGTAVDAHALLPRRLFSGQADLLRDVTLWEIGFPSTSELPDCFSHITSLTLLATHEGPHCRLPNLFKHFFQLRKLGLYGCVTLDDPAFRRAETWDGLAELKLDRLSPETELRNILSLPLKHVPRVALSNCGASGAVVLAEALGPRLSVEFPLLRAETELVGIDFDTRFRTIGHACERAVRMRLVDRGGVRIPSAHPITAFRTPALYGRIVELALSLENWDVLVGEQYIVDVPALERLVLLICESSAGRGSQGTVPTLSCPRLERIILRLHSWSAGPVAIDAALIVEFATKALADVLLPVALELDGVTLCGSFTNFAHIFM